MAEVDGNRTRRTGIACPTRFEGGGCHQVTGHLRYGNVAGARLSRADSGSLSQPAAYRDLVPRLSAFYGIVVDMYIRDHGTPHVHARHSGDEVVVDVATGKDLGGGLPCAR